MCAAIGYITLVAEKFHKKMIDSCGY